MQRIIAGKLYDTETAEEVCDLSPGGYSSSDFKWESTKLYRTAKGAFFIAGEGGAKTRWAESSGDRRGSGSGMELLSEAEARKIAEEHAISPAQYEHFFGKPEEA